MVGRPGGVNVRSRGAGSGQPSARRTYDAAMVGRLVLPLVAVAAVVGCIGVYDIKAPPLPSTTRTPTIIGVIAGRESNTDTYRLADGTLIDVGGPNSSAIPAELLSQPSGGDGSLLLFGEDERGRFYAATRRRDERRCVSIYGQGYIDPGRIHYSSGLVVPFAEDIERKNERDHIDHTWLFDFDLVCLNEAGQVTLIDQHSLGS